jgi:L-rhamnose-H+ transport protein
MSDMLFGFILVFIGSFLQGSWAPFMGFTKKWEWENMWFVYSIFSMIAFNLIIALFFIPNLFQIFAIAPKHVLFIVLLGLSWGGGVVLFGLGIAGAGIALSNTMMFGALLAAGAIIPRLILNPASLVTTQGMVIMLGVLVSLIGIAFSGKAGMMKEKELHGDSADNTDSGPKKMSMRTGIMICVAAGVLISVVNIAFETAGSFVEVAMTLGFNPGFTGNLVWSILFTTGGTINVIYCIYLMGKNKNFGNLVASGTGMNYVWMLIMAFIWAVSFSFFGQGSLKMGAWGITIGWSMFNVIPIITANFWAAILGEWKGVSGATKKTMVSAIGIMLVAIVILTYVSTM